MVTALLKKNRRSPYEYEAIAASERKAEYSIQNTHQWSDRGTQQLANLQIGRELSWVTVRSVVDIEAGKSCQLGEDELASSVDQQLEQSTQLTEALNAAVGLQIVPKMTGMIEIQ